MSNPKSKNYQIVEGKRGLRNPDDFKHTHHVIITKLEKTGKVNSRNQDITKCISKTVVLETSAKEPISLKKKTFSQAAKKYNQVVQLGNGKVRTIRHINNK